MGSFAGKYGGCKFSAVNITRYSNYSVSRSPSQLFGTSLLLSIRRLDRVPRHNRGSARQQHLATGDGLLVALRFGRFRRLHGLTFREQFIL